MGHDNIDFFGIMSRLTFCLLREMLRNEQIWKRWLPNATSFGGGTLKWDVEAMEIKKHRGIVPHAGHLFLWYHALQNFILWWFYCHESLKELDCPSQNVLKKQFAV